MSDRIEPIWLDATDALAIHDRQLAEHGGGSGVRDPGGLESALARAVNRWAYGEDDPAVLAAAYAYGVAYFHPFVDGNKRTAWVLPRLFLVLNGHRLVFDAADAIKTVLALAAGELAEDELADWFRTHIVTD
ncbi:type II toxin-antitoxin system death-on-curing family toxin [Sphingomonas sp. AP4-R1]|uniref:type II toxin-antitoxin system death-on-curing family toxin n=1 Tax=Sphingomonas sp. AP4-R1 TaxID=2735134 RepID=UPI0014932A9C|nr:type II toxin-antitoxin system death-on-curing family toxin [Sphingomonas sp. AP4-R1]QJU60012.1 type II toxin-antitoxin system death-on-curing family toxin [Sphingomonas sp. AP4-R1]